MIGILRANGENYKKNKNICLQISPMMGFSRKLREKRRIGVIVPKFGTSKTNIFIYIQVEKMFILCYLL